jgi:hypothetical protein
MNRLSKQVVVFTIGCVALFSVLGIAGRYDRASQIVYTMPDNMYEHIKLELGDDVSEVDIADYYEQHKEELEAAYGKF